MITFKEIEMTGFKSFADTTHINFDGGITAIVGPNGCGKSNVSDAIRWVLGEQSSKALRGKSMQDVIFAGTEKRKKLSYCEVSLVFDNTQKWFNIEYDEVVLTRKLYRSGESEYMINRKPCRLKDIRDILYDSGIGKDGYSIIGQGRVEEIIQSKPEERRAIFEEAAGIAKYKARKVETENRLERVRDNLSRASDILNEVERRLGPLKRQSEDAKKYLELRDVLKQNEINAYIYQYDHAAQTKQDINEKLTGYRDNLNILTNTMETEQAKYDKSLNEINQLDRKASELHEQVLIHTVALEKRQSDSRLLNEQTRYLKEQLDRLTAQLNAYTLDLNQRTALLSSAEALRDDEQSKLTAYHKESQDIANKYMELIDELTKSEGEKEENQRNIIDNLSKLTDIKANLSAYIAKRDTMAENIKADKEKLSSLESEQETLQREYDQLEKVVKYLKSNKDQKESSIAKTIEKLVSINTELEDLNNRIYALKSSISNDTNRMNILINLQADFEGYQFAVKRLLQDGKKNPTLNNAIKGVVGNIITVDSRYQTAIEIALGGSIQNIVTKDENDAKVLINYLKESKLGRATFLPISAVKPRSISASDRKFLSNKGCLGVASELVNTDSQYRPVIDSLLGATVVCDDLDNAVALAKASGYSFRIVTLEGDVLSPQGSMSGGSKKSNDSSLLSKENEIKALKKNIEDKSKELDTANKEYSSLNEEILKLKTLVNNENAVLQTTNNDFYTNNTKLENIKENLSDVEEEIFSIKSQLNIAENIVKDLDSKINSIDQTELDYNASQAKVNEYNANNKNAYEMLKQKREEYQEILTASKVKIASTEEKINSLNRDIESNHQEIENIKKNIERIDQELSSQQKIYDEAINLNKSKEDTSEVAKIQQQLDELNNKLAQFDDFKQSLMKELKDLDDRKTVLSNDIAKLNNKIYQEETRLQKVDIDIENMQERIYEEYEMTYSDCLPYKTQDENFDIKDTMTQISRIKAQITGLGYVNINAIEEYKTEGARYEEMNTQIEDLRQAEEDAVKIIKDLSAEMLEKFDAEFVKIQENFTKVFKELFGGGNARLELLPSEDPLTRGVEIIAQPPGKVLSNITLLSGGEKTMTAIAILFAILKLKPMPFCFLDEIEAALDDANIDRYAKYLKRFSDETQFIVITHRKPTMEVVDALYGVTMEEKGVSKIVSVKLADAAKIVDTN
ncbi:MAG: chromosome segregation protein SMC [Clostridiales bacterium]|nr:chromosome segregation protein SMC [Clostridiales bacterium]